MAYLALYRKYRPRTFDEVVGQDYVTRILKNQILGNRVGHAYLFTGIRGTGKTSIAKIFARAINCEHNRDGNPCNEAPTCQDIEKPGVMDIIEIDGASNRGVDEIRDIREKVKYPPTMGRYKVYIIDEVHMLTKEAFNALLKTLEEPPGHVVFILATTEPNKLPMTILSRCQRYDIRPISQEAIAGRMEAILKDIGVEMDRDALEFVALRADHSMRDGLSLLDQIIDIREDGKPIQYGQVLDFLGMADSRSILKLVSAMVDGDAAAALKELTALRNKGKDSALIMEQIIGCLRSLAIAAAAGADAAAILALTGEETKEIRALAQKAGRDRLFAMIGAFIEDRQKLKYNDMASVILEMSVLRACVGYAPAPAVQPAVRTVAAPAARPVERPVQAAAASAPGQRVQAPASGGTAVQDKGAAPERRAAPSEPPGNASSPPAGLDASRKEDTAPADRTEQAGADAAGSADQPAETPGRVNTDRVYRAMTAYLAKESPIALRMFEQGRLALKDPTHLELRFLGKEGVAPAQMLKHQGQALKDITRQTAGESVHFDIVCVKKKFEDMSLREKTEIIVNDSRVEIIEKD